MKTNNRMYAIKEVADRFGIKQNKLRFYEQRGLVTPKRNANNGFRTYDQEDLLTIQMILTYRALDLSVEDIKRILEDDKGQQLEQQMFKQLKIVNALMRRYKLIQGGLEATMNAYLKDLSIDKLQEDFMDVATQINTMGQASDWVDLWDFDRFSQSYDEIVSLPNQEGFYKNYKAVLECVYRLATQTLGADGLVLDIGVGTGNLAGIFMDNNYSIMGLDQSVKMMVKAKEKYPCLELKYGDFLNLPFDKACFDRIVTTYAFHHLRDDEKETALIEMVRVLKDWGEIIIGDITLQDQPPEDLITDEEFYTDLKTFIPMVHKHQLCIDVSHIDPYVSCMRIYKARV